MNTTPRGDAIPYEERRRDHENKVAEYLENCMFRGCTDETVRGFKSVLKRMFERAGTADATQPNGYWPALIWELLNPETGYLRIGALVESLLRDNIALDSRRKFITIFRGFLEYVLAKPNIPGSDGETFAEKYGPITLTLTSGTRCRPVCARISLSGCERTIFRFTICLTSAHEITPL